MREIILSCVRIKILVLIFVFFVSGCTTFMPRDPDWEAVSLIREREYTTYLTSGPCTVAGQAFLVKRNGDTVRAAGRYVYLDPVTITGSEWWIKARSTYIYSERLPPSPSFRAARRKTIADVDGSFIFKNVPRGQYFISTTITWDIGGYHPREGGVVGKMVVVKDDAINDVILCFLAAESMDDQ